MSFNTSGAQGVPLSVFGGWVTEISPTAVPEGCSPDNAETMYLPGSAYSRPGFEKVFENPFPAGGPNDFSPTVVAGKSIILPSGQIQNLWFDSNGIMWLEDWSSSPGTYSQLFISTPGSFCKMITAFGRVYIAISDGLHGTDISYWWDGQFLGRVTQDGPAAPPTVSSLALASSQMVGSGNTLTRSSNIVTCATATAHNLQVGYQAQISNVPDSNSTSVVQTNNSAAQTVGGSYWEEVDSVYRSLFNPGTSPLSAFVARNFGFTIPSSATILGAIVSFRINAQSTTTGTVNQVSLWSLGAQLGTLKSPGTPITVAGAVNNYGSAGDSWGAALTPAIVNDPSFGFAISVACDTIRVFIDAPASPITMQVYYTLSGSGTVALVESIAINNETNPGLALVTTTEPHGLIPGIDVSIVGVEPGSVADVSAAQWSSGLTTITTQTSHNLNPGATIQINGITTSTSGTEFSFNGTFVVASVPSPNELTYNQVPINADDPDVIDATADTGALTIAWPIPDNTPTPTYFQVDSCPTSTTFYIQVSYSDGTWTSGTVGFIWEGIFYVTAVLSSTEFQYQQYGPNGETSAVGTVTPFGQAAPGLHLCQQMFLFQDGSISAPSPYVSFIANGGQYVQVDDMAIGPPNVIGRILQFTGAQPDVPGILPPFFYLAVPSQLQGQVVSTATQINDNTTTSILLDFSDNSLFAAAASGGATSVTGNNLVNQIVIDGALGFAYWGSRLTTWGQRATVQEFLNLGFDGGENSSGNPLHWTVNSSGGSLVAGKNNLGWAWQVVSGGAGNWGSLSQGAYEDTYGDPILDGNVTYAVRFWAKSISGVPTVNFSITSASASFSATASLSSISASGGWYQITFSEATPLTIPTDMEINLYVTGATGATVQIDEASYFDSQNPYSDTQGFTSYTNNPCAFDGVTGNIQPTEDTRKIMDFVILRDTPYCVTQDPAGRVHQITVNPTSEPSGWEWNEVQANCGTLSAFGVTHSESDDETASSGDDWTAWPMEGGTGLFNGGQVYKISQEIQPNWNAPYSSYPWVPAGSQINMAAAQTISSLNDPVERMIYWFVPVGSATAPNTIYAMSYRNLNDASAIVNSPPVHVSIGGKLVVTDNTRKWSPWYRSMNGAARMYRDSGQLSTVFFGGNGSAIGTAAGFGNAYTLQPGTTVDDDYGVYHPLYTTYFFIDSEKAQALQLGFVRLMSRFVQVAISGTGTVTYTVLVNSLTNPWPLTAQRALATSPTFDQEFAGCQAKGNRMALQITAPSFNLQHLQWWFSKDKLQLRGAAQ